MTLMWVTLGAMAILGAIVVVMPVLTFRHRDELSGEIINAMVFKDRLKELESDLKDGRIDEQEYNQLQQELELTLLDDVAVSRPDQVRGQVGGKWLIWPLLVLIPLCAGVVYWNEGYRPELSEWFENQERMQRVLPLMMQGNFDAVEEEGIGVDDFIRALQKQLQSNPDDAKGWYLLGASYLQVRMPEQSELAFRRALSLEPDNVDYVMGFTQATLAINDGQLTPEIRRTLEQVMRAQPANPKPYMTLGMALLQGGDAESAIAVWETYMQRGDADPKAVQLLQRSIEFARNQIAEQGANSATQPSVSGADQPKIAVTVNIADAVRAQLQATDILFVYAKALSGPPMPLAVVRQAVADWPVSVVLSDDNAMTPAMTLSKFEQVVVQARISPSGNAITQSGDWIGPTQQLSVAKGTQSVTLIIDRRKP
jgi:cytochrome c-type biogenesis protein CcmH